MDFFKKHPIKIALGCLSLVFLLSVAICAQNWNSRLALAFTAIASLSTVATLIIAIKLYDRFGLKNQMVVKQADKIFDLLLTQTIVADGAHANWMIRANLDQLRSISATPLFATDADKIIFIAIENYEKFYDSMVPIKQSYWLPREIQESLDFLALGGTLDTAFDPNLHIKIRFSSPSEADKYGMAITSITLGKFVAGLINLIEHIDHWLKKHSEVEITLVTRY